MAVRTRDMFAEDLGSASYSQRREEDQGSTYDNTAQLLARGLMNKSMLNRRAQEEEAARVAEIEERAAEYSDYDNNIDTATHHGIVNRTKQGAVLGPWGMLGGAIVGTGEAVMHGIRTGQKGEVAKQLLDPREFIPGALDAVGGFMSGRNASGVDSPELAAADMARVGGAAMQGWNNRSTDPEVTGALGQDELTAQSYGLDDASIGGEQATDLFEGMTDAEQLRTNEYLDELNPPPGAIGEEDDDGFFTIGKKRYG